MNNTLTINNLPDGYELTGEYRSPRKGEPYLNVGRSWIACDDHAAGVDYPILRKLETPTAPEGYELTGEYRTPREGDYYYYPHKTDEAILCDGHQDSCKEKIPRWILRPVWQAPSWMPKGCWLWQLNGCYWMISKSKPVPRDKFWDVSEPPMADAVIWAHLHSETFTPPTHTNCLQVQ